jgi:signal transduction histidine kinase
MRLAEVAGKSLFSLFPDLHERKLVVHFERALAGESSVLSTSLHRYLLPLPSPFRGSGPAQMLQTARIAPLYLEGKICGIVLVIEDVTQRESQAEALERQHRRDGLLSWALAHLLKTEQPRKAVRQLFFKIAEQMDFDTFLVYLRDNASGELRLEAVGGVPMESDKEFLDCPFPTAVTGGAHEIAVLQTKESLAGPEYGALRNVGVSAAVAIPLFANERNLGLLCLATCTRHTIAADESELLATIGQYLATALDRENTNAQLHQAKELLSEHAQLLEKRVQERTARLRETVSELETFSYTIAHDLRAPARGMTGYCEVMLEDFADSLPPTARLVVEKIARASKRMETLTRDLLEFSKISRQEIALAPVRIEPIIEDLATLRLPTVRQAITVCAPLHPVRAHPGLLQHVFSNLIDNAMKFVPPSTPPKITVWTEVVPHGSPNTRSRALVFSSTESMLANAEPAPLEKASKHVRIWVGDEGIGIPPVAHQKIFGIFERGFSSDVYEGTGMGLAIVARAMQRMGGTCGVESEPGKGSRFWLELPMA